MNDSTAASMSLDGSAKRAKVRFNGSGIGFHAAVKKRVDAYFDENGISRRGNAAMALKSAFWFGLTALLYAVVVFSDLGLWSTLGVALFLGFSLACIGFNIGHDAIHGAYAERSWLNSLLGWSFQLIGASAYTWAISHNVVHHTYTNVPGHDGDIEPGPLLRFHTSHPVRPLYRFQHLYAWPLYCFVSLIWVFTKDFEQIARPDPRSGKRAPLSAWASVIAAKVLHAAFLIVIPLLYMTDRFALWQLAVGYLAMHAVGGFTLSIVFQMAHVVEGPTMPSTADDGSVEDSWAEHQMRTTANFSRGSFMAQFICGGLNHQIEHHLFPKICHIHYPAIAPIVIDTAKEFGLPYHEHATFMGAVASHARLLKHLGTAPQRHETMETDALPSAA